MQALPKCADDQRCGVGTSRGHERTTVKCVKVAVFSAAYVLAVAFTKMTNRATRNEF